MRCHQQLGPVQQLTIKLEQIVQLSTIGAAAALRRVFMSVADDTAPDGTTGGDILWRKFIGLPDTCHAALMSHLEQQDRRALRLACSQARLLTSKHVASLKIFHREDDDKYYATDLHSIFPAAKEVTLTLDDDHVEELALVVLSNQTLFWQLERLTCTGQLTLSSMVMLFSAAKDLRHLCVNSMVREQQGFTSITRQLTQLTSLSVQVCEELDNMSIQELSRLTNLQELRLDDVGAAVSDEGFACLTQLSGLVHLHIIGSSMNGQWLTDSSSFKNVTHLELHSKTLCAALVAAAVPHLTALQVLDLQLGRSLSEENLLPLSVLAKLTSLQFSAFEDEEILEISERGLAAIKHLSCLKHLAIDKLQCDVSPFSITTIESLNIWNCTNLTSSTLPALLTTFPNIRKLAIYECHQLENADMSVVANHWKHLERFELGGHLNFTDVGLAVLITLPKLQEVELRNCQEVYDSTIAFLALCPHLKKLVISDCGPVTEDQCAEVLSLLQRSNISIEFESSDDD